jgi:VWFA-related protein
MPFRFSAIILTFMAITLCVLGQKEKDKKQKDDWPSEYRTNLQVVDSSNGNPVDIKREDIKLFEDNVEQKITYFTKQTTAGLSFTFDNSRSLLHLLETEVTLAKMITNNLSDTDEAMVVRFVSSDKITINRQWTTDRKALNETFDNMFMEGGSSAVRDALYLTIEKVDERNSPDGSKRFAVILLSDGEDGDSFYNEKQLYALMAELKVPVYAVGLMRDYQGHYLAKEKAIEFLQSVALRSGGAAYFLDKKFTNEDVIKVAKSIISELHSPYVIGYTSTNQQRDGKLRELRVEIADGPRGEKRKAILKRNFMVPNN